MTDHHRTSHSNTYGQLWSLPGLLALSWPPIKRRRDVMRETEGELFV